MDIFYECWLVFDNRNIVQFVCILINPSLSLLSSSRQTIGSSVPCQRFQKAPMTDEKHLQIHLKKSATIFPKLK